MGRGVSVWALVHHGVVIDTVEMPGSDRPAPVDLPLAYWVEVTGRKPTKARKERPGKPQDKPPGGGAPDPVFVKRGNRFDGFTFVDEED
jgi:hypothetical protein